MATKILGIYEIHYVDRNIKQIKNLISHEDFKNIVKVKNKEIYELSYLKINKDLEISIIKKELKELFGNEYFTTKSPLHNAIITKKLSLPILKEDINCIVKLL